MKRTIDVGEGKKLVVEVTPAITKAAKKAIQDITQFAAKSYSSWGHKFRTTVSLKGVEELLAIHGIGMARSFKNGMKEAILTDAAFGGSKKAYTALAKSKSGRNMIKQLKIRKP